MLSASHAVTCQLRLAIVVIFQGQHALGGNRLRTLCNIDPLIDLPWSDGGFSYGGILAS